MWAKLIAIHIDLMEKQKEIPVSRLEQFLMTAPCAVSRQAGGRGGVVYLVANLDFHSRSAFRRNTNVTITSAFSVLLFFPSSPPRRNRGEYDRGNLKKSGVGRGSKQ